MHINTSTYKRIQVPSYIAGRRMTILPLAIITAYCFGFILLAGVPKTVQPNAARQGAAQAVVQSTHHVSVQQYDHLATMSDQVQVSATPPTTTAVPQPTQPATSL